MEQFRKEVEQHFKEMDISYKIKITGLDTELVKKQKTYQEGMAELQRKNNILLAAQEEARNVQAEAFNRLIQTQEKLKVIKSQTDIPVTQIQVEITKLVDQIDDIKRQETVKTAEAQVKIHSLQNEMQTGLIDLEKKKIELDEMRRKSEQALQMNQAEIAALVAKYGLDNQERQNAIDLEKIKNDFWWVTLPRTVGFIVLGAITILIVLAIIRGILNVIVVR